LIFLFIIVKDYLLVSRLRVYRNHKAIYGPTG